MSYTIGDIKFDIYPFHLKILDFCYRFLRLRNFKKLAIGQAITRFLKFRRRKNQVAKKPVSSGGMGINSHTDELNHNIIDDILVSLSVEEYKLLLTRLHDPHAEARNAPYPYFFQNALKHYNEFAALELPKLSSDYQAIQDKTSAKAHHILQQAYKIQQTKQLMARLQEFSMPFVVLQEDQIY